MAKLDDLKTHMNTQSARLFADLDAHQAHVEKKLGEVGAVPTVVVTPPPSFGQEVGAGIGAVVGGIETGVGNVVHGAGAVIGGVASTGADAIGTVGTIADGAHNAIDGFFSDLRKRLGI